VNCFRGEVNCSRSEVNCSRSQKNYSGSDMLLQFSWAESSKNGMRHLVIIFTAQIQVVWLSVEDAVHLTNPKVPSELSLGYKVSCLTFVR
jgi:hypothetical protein